MRFACQSCGKAYNLPEEKIADKSNVKLKCRVCGAIVEVKRQGEVVAQLLEETDLDLERRRLSEAPAPITSLAPEDMLTGMSADDDGDDATQAIAVGDQILAEGGAGDDAASALLGHVRSTLNQRGLGPLPAPPPTGFAAPPTGFASPPTGFASPPAGFAPTPVPPPLAVPDLPRLDPARAEPPAPFRPEPAPPVPPGFGSAPASPPPPFGAGPASPPPPLPNPSLSGAGLGSPAQTTPGPLPGAPFQNGSNGAVPRFGDVMSMPEEPLPPLPMPSAPGLPRGGVMSSAPPLSDGGFGGPSFEVSQVQPTSDDTTRKMLAALATGILIGFIIARLFF